MELQLLKMFFILEAWALDFWAFCATVSVLMCFVPNTHGNPMIAFEITLISKEQDSFRSIVHSNRTDCVACIPKVVRFPSWSGIFLSLPGLD